MCRTSEVFAAQADRRGAGGAAGLSGRSGVTYRVTDEGRRVTEDFGRLRRRLLIAAIESLPGFAERLNQATRTLNLLSGIYEEVARTAATHRRGQIGASR